jgi:hypothetical protein
MGKRSDFQRVERDYYVTPRSALLPLLPHLRSGTRFIEPCAGNGALVDLLQEAGHICLEAYDIEPQRADILQRDALTYVPDSCEQIDQIITNSPWLRTILHPLIIHLSDIAPTWLLFDADWSHTVRAAPYLDRLHKIVSVGRVKWFEGSAHSGKDNCAWYLFGQPCDQLPRFVGRSPKQRFTQVNHLQESFTSSPIGFDELIGGESVTVSEWDEILG